MTAPLHTSNPADFEKLEGVYIYEQTPPGFVKGASLNTPIFFGQTLKGPVDEQVLITSEQRFLDVFGGRSRDGGGALVNQIWRDIQNKVFGPFWVVRACAAAAATASFTFETAAGGAGTAVLKVSASSPGLWGLDVKASIEAATDEDANHFNLRVSYLGTEYLFENLDISSTNDNLETVIGDDHGTHIRAEKLAAGVPHTNAAGTGAFAAALDSDGFINLGETVTGYTSVAGTDGTIASSDYTGTGRAIDQVKEFKGINGVSIVLYSEDDETIVGDINEALITASAGVSDRMFLIWSGDYAATVEEAITYQGTLNRSDRVVHCFNAPYTLDKETGTQMQTPPTAWLASILSQIDVDIHPGEEATKQFTRGISKLTLSPTRADYELLRAAGIAAFERDNGYAIVSGVTTDLTPGKEEITRRRSADFLQLSASDRLKYYVKKKNTPATRRAMGGDLIAFSQGLKSSGRVVENYSIDQVSVNTEEQRARGLEFIYWEVDLIGHILSLVLKTNIGTGVTIEV